MIRDQSRGRVWFDVRGKPLVTYNLVPQDVELLQRAIVSAGRLCWAAGARRVHLGMIGVEPVDSAVQFERLAERPLRASDLALISYHPLGTCKMGRDRRTSLASWGSIIRPTTSPVFSSSTAVRCPGPQGQLHNLRLWRSQCAPLNKLQRGWSR